MLYNAFVTPRRKLFSAIIITVFLLVAGLALGLVSFAAYWQQQPMTAVVDQRLELLPGQSFTAFANDLSNRGLLEHPRLWSILVRLRGQARRLQAGEYWVRVGDSPAVLLDRVLRGEVVVYEVKFLEGWTVGQTLNALADHPALAHDLAGADVLTLLGALGLPEGNAEGLFFPDTYRFEKGASDADILRRAYQALQIALESAWLERDAGLPYATPYDALIVASLIEKETGRDDDRDSIAQVFVSRLNIGMRLQTDPSVIYGIGPEFDGNLTRRHLKTDSAYNTYTRKGLPPSPIALVGARSLQAAVHPAAGAFLYFVSRGDGSSQFSASLKEHQAAVRKYQLQ